MDALIRFNYSFLTITPPRIRAAIFRRRRSLSSKSHIIPYQEFYEFLCRS